MIFQPPMYLINPHVIARELLNWLRLFWHKRKLAQIHQAEMVNHLALLVEVQVRLNVEFVFYFDGAGQVL